MPQYEHIKQTNININNKTIIKQTIIVSVDVLQIFTGPVCSLLLLPLWANASCHAAPEQQETH